MWVEIHKCVNANYGEMQEPQLDPHEVKGVWDLLMLPVETCLVWPKVGAWVSC